MQGPHGEALSFVYESRPCGYGVFREITETGPDCQVVSPSLIPRKPGDRAKTDRRDAVSLARLHRAGDTDDVGAPPRPATGRAGLSRRFGLRGWPADGNPPRCPMEWTPPYTDAATCAG